MGFYYDFENADAFATGAIGTPGERTFYMQVRADGRTVSVKCEKQQVAALAQYLRNMLADMPDMTGSVNNSTAMKQLGNSVAVKAVHDYAREIIKSLNNA